MADNIDVTPGTGTTIAADDIGSGVLAQRVKILASADGSAADLTRAEDAAHTSGDHGIMALGVRSDTAASLAGTDGDYVPFIVDSSGRLHCNVGNTITVNSHAVTNAGTFAVQAVCTNAGTFAVQAACTNAGTFAVQESGTALTRLTTIAGAVYAEDVASAGADPGVAILAVRRDSASSGVGTDGDYAQVSVDSTGRLWCNVSNTVTVAAHAVTNAGTFVTQENGAALTSLQLIDDVVYAEDVAAADGDKGLSILAVRRDAAAVGSGTDGDYSTLNVDASGRLWCNVANTVTVGSHAVTNAGTFAVQAAVTAASGSFSSGCFASGSHASGAFASGAFASGSIATGAIADMLVDDAAFTPGTSRVMPMGCQADETSTDSVDEGDVGCPRMTLDRKQLVTLQAHTAGGATPFYNLDVDESEDAIKTSAGQLYELYLFNATAAILYVKLYDDTVANVVVGTTVPVMTIPVPADSGSLGGGVTRQWPSGLVFANAITIAATTGLADNNSGAPATNALLASGAYK